MNTPAFRASRAGAFALGAIALGCAGFAAYLASHMMSSRYAKTTVTPVVVAKVELKVGEQVTANDLRVVDWPQEAVPAGAFSTVKDVLDTFEKVSPTVGILAGEPVVKARLSNPGLGTGVAALVRPGMRAVALQVDASVANTGLVYPGAYVDVIATFRDQDGTGPTASMAVQRAKVLSVGFDVDVATRDKPEEQKQHTLTRSDTTYVTLEVTPEQAEVIAVSRAEAHIEIALRNGTDDSIVETPGARPLDIIPQIITEEEIAAEADEGNKAKSSGATASRRDAELTERAARRRVRRIRLSAKPVETERTKPSGIETYRAN